MAEAAAATAVATKRLKIDMALLNSIPERGNGRNALQVNQLLQLEDTGRTETVDKKEFPVYSMGNGQSINLAALGNFLIADDSFTAAVVNVGEKEECLAQDRELTTMKKFMIDNNGDIPATIKIVNRVRSGARPEFLKDEAKGAIRAEGYKLLGLSTEKDYFPVIWTRASEDPKVAENWKFFDRIGVQVVE